MDVETGNGAGIPPTRDNEKTNAISESNTRWGEGIVRVSPVPF